MTALTTQVREAVAAAAGTVGVAVFDHVPATVTFPAVVLLPDAPWLTRSALSAAAFDCHLRLSVLVKAYDNRAGLTACEDLVEALLHALDTAGAAEWVEVSPPALQDFGAQGSGYVTEVKINRPTRKA